MSEAGGTSQDISAAVRLDAIGGRARGPVLWCILATIIAVPVWFFACGAYIEVVNPDHNPFAPAIYSILCLISMVPVAILNAVAIAPAVARRLEGKETYVRAFLLNALLLLAGGLAIVGWAGLLAACGTIWAQTIITEVLAWTIIPWHMAIFMLPPVVAGSLAYSCRIVASRRRIDKG